MPGRDYETYAPVTREEGVHWCPYCKQHVEAFSSQLRNYPKKIKYWEHKNRAGDTCAGSKEALEPPAGILTGFGLGAVLLAHILRPDGWYEAGFIAIELGLVGLAARQVYEYKTAPTAPVTRDFEVSTQY